ncbi:MAG: murein L,D-transpeptidase, partial [Chlorobiaceae bacterium]|nr:murein L,D-transpeptidase [Chlorobiaceae bacterium]
MTGILLLWLAFTPVQTPAGKHIPADQQQHQYHDPAASAAGNTALVRNLPETIRNLIRESGEKRQFNRHLYEFYATRHFQTFWTRPEMVAEMIAAIDGATDEGLDPQDYHGNEIRELIAGFPLTLDRQALYDVLLTDAYLTLASHLHNGKVDPGRMEPTWNLTEDASYSALEYRLQNAVSTNRVAAVLQELRPQQ